jgi:hypothetical protein
LYLFPIGNESTAFAWRDRELGEADGGHYLHGDGYQSCGCGMRCAAKMQWQLAGEVQAVPRDTRMPLRGSHEPQLAVLAEARPNHSADATGTRIAHLYQNRLMFVLWQQIRYPFRYCLLGR